MWYFYLSLNDKIRKSKGETKMNLLRKEAFWLGGPVIVAYDPRKTDLVSDLEGELNFCGVHMGPAAMYGLVKTVRDNGDIVVRFFTAMGSSCGSAESDDEQYDFEVPKGMYIVVSRVRIPRKNKVADSPVKSADLPDVPYNWFFYF